MIGGYGAAAGSLIGVCRRVGIGRRGGLKIHCQRWRAGSSPAAGTTSEQSPLCSDVLFVKRTSSAHFLAPPFQITTASLGCDLVKTRGRERIFSVNIKNSSCAHSAAPRFQPANAALVCRLMRRGMQGERIFSVNPRHIGAKPALLRRSFGKKNVIRPRCPQPVCRNPRWSG